MVFAPEFGDAAVTVVLIDQTHFDIYRQLPDGTGVLQWTVIGQLWPPVDLPYVAGSPEVFTYNGRTWIMMTLKATSPPVAPTSVTIAAIDPAHPEWRVLTDNNSAPNRWRADPEYYKHADSVYIYYSRTDLTSKRGEGVWRVDTGLGPPQR